MYLRRKLDLYLKNWKNDTNHKPLIVKGARQIGKTESICQFAKNYESFININFALETKYKTICEDGYEVDSIIKNISRIDTSKEIMKTQNTKSISGIQAY